MSVRDTWTAVLMNTSTEYLDHRFGADSETEDIVAKLMAEHRAEVLASSERHHFDRAEKLGRQLRAVRDERNAAERARDRFRAAWRSARRRAAGHWDAATWIRDERDAAEQRIRAAALNEGERTMLRFALDLAQEQICSRGDEFTEADPAAVDSLRRMAAAGQAPAGDGWCSDPDCGPCSFQRVIPRDGYRCPRLAAPQPERIPLPGIPECAADCPCRIEATGAES